MATSFTPKNYVIKYREISEATLKNYKFDPGTIYVTDKHGFYFDSPVHNYRVSLNGTNIVKDAVDLNDYIYNGIYSIENVMCDNSPLASKGFLEVNAGESIIMQTFRSISGNVYTRLAYDQVGIISWNAWKRVGD